MIAITLPPDVMEELAVRGELLEPREDVSDVVVEYGHRGGAPEK